MAQWEDDLRAVVEHRGAALVERARGLVAPADDPADPAVDLTADALAAAFRRGGRRATGDQGFRIVTDDDLDTLAAQVEREQDLLARDRPRTFVRRAGELPTPDDGPSDELTARLAEVVARVGVARRRGRRRALLGSAAVVVVAALATTAFAARPWDRPTPDPAPSDTPYAGACGATLPTGRSLLPVTFDDSSGSGANTITPDGWWQAVFIGGATEPTTAELDLVDRLTPEVVLARDGTVVALGINASTVSDDGSTSVAPPTFDDFAPDSPLYLPVRFAACDGGDVEAGTYQAYLYATTEDQQSHVLSDSTDLTVLSPTPDGYQPTWLEGSPLACGENADDFITRAAAHSTDHLLQTGTASYDDGEAVIIRNDEDTPLKAKVPRAAVAWVQGGRIVGVGADERATRTTTLAPGKQVELSAHPWDVTDYCDPATGTEPGLLPAGAYQAILYARVPSAHAGEPDGWIVEDERGNDLVIGADGHVTSGDDAGADALALVKKGFQPAWVRRSALTCGMTDSAFTQASAESPAVELDGSYSMDDQGRLSTNLAVPKAGKATVTTPARIGLAWFTSARGDVPGRLVSFGSSPGSGRTTTIQGGEPRDTVLDATSSCAPGADGSFAEKLPEGRYWVAAYTWVQRSGGPRQWVTDGGAMGVAVKPDGSVVGR